MPFVQKWTALSERHMNVLSSSGGVTLLNRMLGYRVPPVSCGPHQIVKSQ